MAEKQYHISTILCITTGRLVAHTKLGYQYPIYAVYDILDYMSGESLYTHALPRVADEAKPVILALYPQLAEVVCPGFDVLPTNQNVQSFIDDWIDNKIVPKYGEYLTIYPMHTDDHVRIDPIEEAANMFGKDRVIVVDMSGGDTPDSL